MPYDWLIWPEERVLIAHALDGVSYRVAAAVSDQPQARIPPFEEVELDLAYILGE